jgi:hypothetical protein
LAIKNGKENGDLSCQTGYCDRMARLEEDRRGQVALHHGDADGDSRR